MIPLATCGIAAWIIEGAVGLTIGLMFLALGVGLVISLIRGILSL